MADILLEQIVNQAISTIQRAFGENLPSEGEGAGRYLNLAELKKAYRKEADREVVVQELTKLARSVRKMRSSYLPIDFFKNEAGFFSANIADTVADMESYENAFMRMLGMPIVGDGSAATSKITSAVEGNGLKILDPNTGETKDVSYEQVVADILDQRQQARNQRKIVVSDSVYNINQDLEREEAAAELETLLSFASAIKSPFLGTDSLPAEADITEYPRLTSIEDDIFKFSYLLLPPIQDGRISGCINEPDKLVAPPFSNTKTRQINNVKIRPTLLESVIRIRLDKISGTDTFTSTQDSESSGPFDVELELGTEGTTSINADNFGILEALFILRLRSALGGLASKLMDDIDDVIAAIQKANKQIADTDPNTGAKAPAVPNEAASQTKDLVCEGLNLYADDDLICKDLKLRRQQKLIEDSILILLGDNSEVLDLQAQTQRNSSIQDGHLMSGIIDVIDIPRKRIEKEISDIERARRITTSTELDGLRTSINTVLGIDIGIGSLDIIVFALALFTMKEKSLLGLLNAEQFVNLKTGEFKNLLPEEGEREDMLFAVNELTERVIDGYRIFAAELRDDSVISLSGEVASVVSSGSSVT